MTIYVVKPGDSLYSIALENGVSMSQIMLDNQLPDPARLAVGQTLVLQYPQQTHIVQPGETLMSISAKYGLSIRQIQRNNPILGGGYQIWPGQTLVITFQQEKEGSLSINGYAYPFVNRALLRSTMPYSTTVTPFTYGFTPQGDLVLLEDEPIINIALEGGVAPIMHLSTLTDSGNFSSAMASLILNNMALQNRLINNIETVIREKGYRGLDVDFEFIPAKDARPYAAFITRLRERFNPQGLIVLTALAPKTSADQPGLLYEGHNYALLGAAANELLLMTYEWGYT